MLASAESLREPQASCFGVCEGGLAGASAPEAQAQPGLGRGAQPHQNPLPPHQPWSLEGSCPVTTKGTNLSGAEKLWSINDCVFHRGNVSISFICSKIYEKNICRQLMYLSDSEVIRAHDGEGQLYGFSVTEFLVL